MPIAEIVVRFRAEVANFNKAMGSSLERLRRMDGTFREMQTSGGRLAVRFRRMTHGLRGFRMEMLGVMFFGMGMSKFFTGLLKPTLDLVGAFDIMNDTLAIGLLPTGLFLLNNVFLPIMKWFLKQPELVQNLIGTFIIWGVIVGQLTFLVGMFALGIGSLFLVLGKFFAAFISGMILFVLITGAIVGLIFLWKNWEKISWKLKLALAVVLIIIGALLIAFVGTVGWILIIVAAIIGLMAIIKNWGKIVEWIKERWRILLSATTFGRILVAIVDLVKKTKSTWKGFFDWIMAKWNKIKQVVGFVLNPIRTITKGIVQRIAGSKQFGGMIPQDGLYRLHAGEQVVPAGQTLNFAPILNINATGGAGIDIDQIKMELNELWARQIGDLARR